MKKASPNKEAFIESDFRLSFNDLSRLNARCADAHALGCAVHDGAYRAQVHVPAPPTHVVGVADFVSKLRPFAAHFTYSCHDK